MGVAIESEQCVATAGDGAGILVSIPQEFIIRVTSELGIDLPPRNYYGVGMCFLPTESELREKVKALMNEVRRVTAPVHSAPTRRRLTHSS